MSLQWQKIQGLYDEDATQHWERAQAIGVDCPFDVFEQLFWEQHGNVNCDDLYRSINWSEVVWGPLSLSGITLRQVSVDRGYQYAVDEARMHTLEDGNAKQSYAHGWTIKPGCVHRCCCPVT